MSIPLTPIVEPLSNINQLTECLSFYLPWTALAILAAAASVQQGKADGHKMKKANNRKHSTRTNKVAVQRNGPIVRAKKMFTQQNGIYNNRNNC